MVDYSLGYQKNILKGKPSFPIILIVHFCGTRFSEYLSRGRLLYQKDQNRIPVHECGFFLNRRGGAPSGAATFIENLRACYWANVMREEVMG